jgi:hypothetical protein
MSPKVYPHLPGRSTGWPDMRLFYIPNAMPEGIHLYRIAHLLKTPTQIPSRFLITLPGKAPPIKPTKLFYFSS